MFVYILSLQRQQQQQQGGGPRPGMGGQQGGMSGPMANISPNDQAFVMQVQQLTGIREIPLLMQAITTLRSLGPQLTRMLGNLTPQNIQLMLAQVARQVHPAQQPILQRMLQGFQQGQLNPAMLRV